MRGCKLKSMTSPVTCLMSKNSRFQCKDANEDVASLMGELATLQSDWKAKKSEFGVPDDKKRVTLR